MILFFKDDDKREPVVLIMGSLEEAKKKLVKIVDGHGLKGEWKYAKVDKNYAKELRKKFELDTLYTIEAPKIEVIRA